LGALVEECLYKAKLEEANQAEAVRRGEAGRRESEFRSDAERRSSLGHAAAKGLTRIRDTLKEAVMQAASTATVETNREGGWVVQMNQVQMEFTSSTATPSSPWASWPAPAFEVIAHAAIGIQIPANRFAYEGRVHSLWYCDAHEKGRYQWFETAFMVSAFIPKRGRQNPFALDPGEDSAKAVWNGMAEWQVAWRSRR
jgi:serine/threonine-protein kinase